MSKTLLQSFINNDKQMENGLRLDQIEVTASIHILCFSVIGISSRMDCPMFVFQLPDNDFRLKKKEIKLSN
jgi:hypothetical protein